MDFLYLLFLVFLGSIAGLLGGVIFLIKKSWAKRFASWAIPLATGVLLATSLTDLLPHAYEEIGSLSLTIVLFVFVLFFLVEQFFFHLHHHSEDKKHSIKSAVPLVILGDTIHNFLDGVAIAAAFLINPSLGFMVALGTFFHETPHEIADFGILLSAGRTRMQAFKTNFFSALATFPGAFLTIYYADKVESLTGILVSFAAGLFLYIATTDFLPEVAKKKSRFSWANFVIFIIGIAIVFVIGTFVPEFEH